MLKNIVQLEHQVGDKLFRFLCDADSNLSHVKEALFQFMGHCVSAEKAAMSAQEAQKAASEVHPVEAAVEQAKEESNG